MDIPSLIEVRRTWDEPELADPSAAVRDQFRRLAPHIRPGARIAVAAGSRGIEGLAEVIRALVSALRDSGAEPFITPAMGSHGGGTAAGQEAILVEYGIQEAAVGAPVRSSMEVVELDQGQSPVRLFMDRQAFESDGIILVNRIKPHTDFHGRWESGLVKMSVIGLGKHAGAREVHSHGICGLRDHIPVAARQILASGRILGGIAIVENSRHRPMLLRAIPGELILNEEPVLLEVARRHLAGLPVDDLHVLIIERMGKDLSGVGIDTNVIGRIRIPGQPEPPSPRIGAIVVCDLTEASHGNAVGIGLADVVTRRLVNRIDWTATRENVVTSGFLERGKLPVVAESETEAMEIALRSCGAIPPGAARIIRIRDTLHLHEFAASPAVVDALRGRPSFEVLAEPGATAQQ